MLCLVLPDVTPSIRLQTGVGWPHKSGGGIAAEFDNVPHGQWKRRGIHQYMGYRNGESLSLLKQHRQNMLQENLNRKYYFQ